MGGKLYLDLGTVRNLARVRLNNQDLGVVWCAPWRVEISPVVKPAGNTLAITVVNTWANRLIGDELSPRTVSWSLGILRNAKAATPSIYRGEA